MQVEQRLEERHDDVMEDLALRQAAVCEHRVPQEVPQSTHLHDQVQFRGGLHCVAYLHDARVLVLPQDTLLRAHAPLQRCVHALLVVHLHPPRAACQMRSQYAAVHPAESVQAEGRPGGW